VAPNTSGIRGVRPSPPALDAGDFLGSNPRFPTKHCRSYWCSLLCGTEKYRFRLPTLAPFKSLKLRASSPDYAKVEASRAGRGLCRKRRQRRKFPNRSNTCSFNSADRVLGLHPRSRRFESYSEYQTWTLSSADSSATLTL
jgi:hypothetical protein